MVDVLLAIGPELAVGRGRDLVRHSGGQLQRRMADVLAAEARSSTRRKKTAA
jgi:hypothetical protein